jgi:lipid II:glycine glycyltransferase (peptidoglycan interpeptide bridge formation enzyme)
MLQQFRSIYEQTMARLNATPFYFFPEEYYISLQNVFSSDMAVGVAYYDAQPVSAALFLADSQFGHYHLSGVTREGKQHKAQTMVVVEGAKWMRRRGCRWFHLGGGRASADSLYYFKHSFGARTFHYSYLTLITNRARYDELVNLRRMQTELAAPVNDFFPAYRGPEQ